MAQTKKTSAKAKKTQDKNLKSKNDRVLSAKKKNVFEGANLVYQTNKHIVRLDADFTPVRDSKGVLTNIKSENVKRKYFKKSDSSIIDQARQYYDNLNSTPANPVTKKGKTK